MAMKKVILPAPETPAGVLSSLAPGSKYDTRDSSQCVPLLEKETPPGRHVQDIGGMDDLPYPVLILVI